MPTNYKYVTSKLISIEVINADETSKFDKHIREFCCDYLHRDGLLILRLTGINSSDLVATELVRGLWYCYMKELDSSFEVPCNNTSANTDNPSEPSFKQLPEHHTLLGAAAAIDESAMENEERQKKLQKDRRQSLKRKNKR